MEDPRAALRPVIVGALLGVCDVDGGPTDEQRRFIDAIGAGLFGLAGSELHQSSLSPSTVASDVSEPMLRRRVVQLAIVASACRHPASPKQMAALGDLARLLDVGADEVEVLQVLVASGVERATTDFVRRYGDVLPDLSELRLHDRDGIDHLPTIMAGFAAMDDGSLGRAYLAFHERNGFRLPGPSTPEPAYYVSHDMNHVLAGYEPTGPGEIALGAFKIAMGDTDANWMAFLANVLIHEVGLVKHGDTEQFVPYGGPIYPDDRGQGALHLDGAASLVAEGFDRGFATRVDFSQMDHLAMAPRQLSDLRREFNVVRRADGFDGGTGSAWVT